MLLVLDELLLLSQLLFDVGVFFVLRPLVLVFFTDSFKHVVFIINVVRGLLDQIFASVILQIARLTKVVVALAASVSAFFQILVAVVTPDSTSVLDYFADVVIVKTHGLVVACLRLFGV